MSGTDARRAAVVRSGSATLQRMAYTVYGFQDPLAFGESGLAFNGELRDATTGWYLLGDGRRAYNPILARFHSPDALSPFAAGGLNAYAYCKGDPVNLVDPTGQFYMKIMAALDTVKKVAGYTKNIAKGVFLPLPSGLLGYAEASKNVGYAVMGTGLVMQRAGSQYATAVLSGGTALVTAGASVKKAYKLVKTVREVGRSERLRGVMNYISGRRGSQAAQANLESVVVSGTRGSPSKDLSKNTSPVHTNHNIRGAV